MKRAIYRVIAGILILSSAIRSHAQEGSGYLQPSDYKEVVKYRPAEMFRHRGVGDGLALYRNRMWWRSVMGSTPYALAHWVPNGVALLSEGRVKDAAIYLLPAYLSGLCSSATDVFWHLDRTGADMGGARAGFQRFRGTYLPMMAPTMAYQLIRGESVVKTAKSMAEIATAGVLVDQLADRLLLPTLKLGVSRADYTIPSGHPDFSKTGRLMGKARAFATGKLVSIYAVSEVLRRVADRNIPGWADNGNRVRGTRALIASKE